MDKDDTFIRIYDSYDKDYEGGDHGHSHSHGDQDEDLKNYNASMKKLKIVSFVSIFFIAAQLTGGYLANSIAIYTDSAHLGSDMIGFAISMAALKLAMSPASKELTFGWHRAEVLGTLISIIFLLTLTIWLVFEAVDRVVEPVEVKGFEMAVTAVAGLGFNLIQMRILHSGEGHYHLGGDDHGHSHGDGEDHGHSHGGGGGGQSLAVDAAFLHALGDMIMSIGVCIAATIIYFFPEYTIADPICTFVFSVIVCGTVIPVVKKCIIVLMEGTPEGFPVAALIEDINLCGDGEEFNMHDFHLWQISQGKLALSAHVKSLNPSEVLMKITKMCQKKYNIDHLTIQMEDASPDNKHQFECEQTTHKKLDVSGPNSPTLKE